MPSKYNLYLKHNNNLVKAPLSLNEVKEFLHIEAEFKEQDNLLYDLLNMATEYAEWYTGKSLMKKEWNIVCIGQIPSKLYLPHGPIISVTKVFCPNHFTITKYNYNIEIIGGYIEFFNMPHYGKVNIEYVAGYETVEEMPQVVKEGILHHISSAYHNRDNTQFTSQVKKLYDQFREVRLTL